MILVVDFSNIKTNQLTLEEIDFSLRNTLDHVAKTLTEEMDPEHFILDRAQKDLADLCQQMGITSAKQEVRLTTHSAKSEIVNYATDQDFGLIVIGARGRHNLLDLLSGSTATGVVRAAPCDVFVMHEREEPK